MRPGAVCISKRGVIRGIPNAFHGIKCAFRAANMNTSAQTPKYHRDEWASRFQAFDVGAVRYIVKPFEKSRLLDTIRQALAIAEDQRSISDFLSAGVDDRDKPRYITVKSGGVNTRVILTDIVYAEVFDRRVVLHMQDRECIEYYGRMTELERVAGSDFFRPHRAYLINLRFVSSYDSRTVCVQGTVIPVARGKYRELVRASGTVHTAKH